MKDLDRCNSDTVSTSVLEAIRSFNLDPKHCLYWLTDNTNYMSGSKGGAVINFNQKCETNTIRIPCSLHAVHIAAITFDNTVFGKISSPSGLSLSPHPFNVINLAYHLHSGYNESNKDNPLNMKNETINKMYKALLNIDLKKYQKPITSRWLYQLTTAKQYLECRELHFTFADWFIKKLEGSRNVPEGYLHKWKTFLEFLQNEKLNIEILIMVKFGEWFYERMMYFLIGSDTNSSHSLPNGYRAHQMPDMVQIWISELENIIHKPEEIFADELSTASDHLDEQDFLDLAQRIQVGIEKTLNVFKKWMITWTKFPLCICSLGGEHGPKFAQAVLHVIFSHSLPDKPTTIVKKYVERLNENLEDRNNSFGLFEAFEKNDFREQFVAFSKANYIQLKEFPLIYDFVRHRIWPIIVHQQHLEGMFNKFDIRTHPNMSDSLQEARLQLSGPTFFNSVITEEKLALTRAKGRGEASLSANIVIGEEEAIKMAEKFLVPKSRSN
jgi:fumarate reductase subunit C